MLSGRHLVKWLDIVLVIGKSDNSVVSTDALIAVIQYSAPSVFLPRKCGEDEGSVRGKYGESVGPKGVASVKNSGAEQITLFTVCCFDAVSRFFRRSSVANAIWRGRDGQLLRWRQPLSTRRWEWSAKWAVAEYGRLIAPSSTHFYIFTLRTMSGCLSRLVILY